MPSTCAQLTRDLFAIAKFLFILLLLLCCSWRFMFYVLAFWGGLYVIWDVCLLIFKAFLFFVSTPCPQITKPENFYNNFI